MKLSRASRAVATLPLRRIYIAPPATTLDNETAPTMPTVHLLDYVAGNIRSLVNAIEKLGYQVEWIKSPEDVPKAEVRPAHAI